MCVNFGFVCNILLAFDGVCGYKSEREYVYDLCADWYVHPTVCVKKRQEIVRVAAR